MIANSFTYNFKLNLQQNMNCLTKITLFLLLSISMLNNSSAQSQDFRADLIKVYQKFEKSDFKMELKMKIIHWDASAPVVSTGKVKRKGANYYTSFDGQLNLRNARFTVLVTERDKNIIYLPNQKNEEKVDIQDPLTMMKDTSLFKNVKLITTSAAGKVYEINQPQYGVKKMQLKISKQGVLKEVKYYYEKTEESPIKEVLITYSNVVFNPTFSSTEFSEKKYFKIVNGKAVLTPVFKNYTITNGGYTK